MGVGRTEGLENIRIKGNNPAHRCVAKSHESQSNPI